MRVLRAMDADTYIPARYERCHARMGKGDFLKPEIDAETYMESCR
jgi:hypothetical protein